MPVAAATSLAALLVSTAAQADLTISTNATSNIVCASGVCTPTKKGANLNVTQLQTLLASGNVKVTTASSNANFIIIDAALSWASSYNLTLNSYKSVKVNNPVAVNGTGGLSVVLNDGSTGGALAFSSKAASIMPSLAGWLLGATAE